ncbi:unnamed protein product, partial [marine sediment metagenome]
AEIWSGKKKMDSASAVIITSVALLAIFSAYAWWQLNKQPAAARLQTPCYTCGGGFK